MFGIQYAINCNWFDRNNVILITADGWKKLDKDVNCSNLQINGWHRRNSANVGRWVCCIKLTDKLTDSVTKTDFRLKVIHRFVRFINVPIQHETYPVMNGQFTVIS